MEEKPNNFDSGSLLEKEKHSCENLKLKFLKDVEYEKYLDGYITEAEHWRNPGLEKEQEEKSENIQLFIEKVFCKQGLNIQDDLDINEKSIVRKTTIKKKIIGSKQYKGDISSNELMQMQQSLMCVSKSLKCLLKEKEN